MSICELCPKNGPGPGSVLGGGRGGKGLVEKLITFLLTMCHNSLYTIN